MNPDPQLLLSLQISPPSCWRSLLTSPVPYRGVNEIRMFYWDTLIGFFSLSSWAICFVKNAKIFLLRNLHSKRLWRHLLALFDDRLCPLFFLSTALRKKKLHPRQLVTWQVSLTERLKSKLSARRDCVVTVLTHYVRLYPSLQICVAMTQTTLLLFSSTHSRSLSRWASYSPVDVNDTSLSFSITKQARGTLSSTVPSCGVMWFCNTTGWLLLSCSLGTAVSNK